MATPGAILERHVFAANQPDEGFVDDSRGLEGVVAPLAPHHRGGDLAKLFVDQRNQPCGRLSVTALDPGEQLRDITTFGHGDR